MTRPFSGGPARRADSAAPSAPRRAASAALSTTWRRDRRAVSAAPPSTSAAAIIDAVADQFGDHWIKYGTARRSTWFSLRELVSESRLVFARIAALGVPIITRQSIEKFKAEVESHAAHRAGLVAARPGWTNNSYVFDNGDVIAPTGDVGELIVAFDQGTGLGKTGTLAGWKDDIYPLIEGQPILLFVLAFAFVGPLMRFAPPGTLNPLVELVGKGGCGKTTAGMLAASVWCGNLDSDIGGAESWNLTLNAFDNVKRQHRDCHLTIDEGNAFGDSQRHRSEAIQDAVMKFASSQAKKRQTDASPAEHTRLAVLSTTNSPLAELTTARGAVLDAITQRMVTVMANRPLGVLDFVPDGSASAAQAVEDLCAATYRNFGVAGEKFMLALTDRANASPSALCAEIAGLMDDYREEAGEVAARTAPRVTKTFALTYAAGSMAWDLGLLPGSLKALCRAIVEIHGTLKTAATIGDQDPIIVVRNWASSNWSDLIPIETLGDPMSETAFFKATGFWQPFDRGTELLIPSAEFQSAFPNYRAMMRTLRDRGLAHTERGENPKLTIKTPSTICRHGRVYCIRLVDSPSSLGNITS